MKQLSEVIELSSEEIVAIIIKENPIFSGFMNDSRNVEYAIKSLKKYTNKLLDQCPFATIYLSNIDSGRDVFEKIQWRGIAAIRIKDYIKNEGREFEDLNLRDDISINRPIKTIWNAIRNNKYYGSPDFYIDWLFLIRQLNNNAPDFKPNKAKIIEWMGRHPTGLDEQVIEQRNKNKKRIINVYIKKLSDGTLKSKRFTFAEGASEQEKYSQALEWWNQHIFHLQLAIRSPQLLNEMLDYSLSDETMRRFEEAEKVGIPFFVNPYYLSLLNVNEPSNLKNSDLAIRDYILYSQNLIDEFGNIAAWEKEDVVEPGKPNAAGWILPSHHNVHRRYPEVAILLPDTVGRACAGLCVSCQRMYDFQSGHLNFDLEKLKPKESWKEKLVNLLNYYKEDSQLRDILITGGDALMSSNKSLKHILNEVYIMAKGKIEANKNRKEDEKYAEMLRVRLGTRMPVYTPQRITPELITILGDFKKKASKIGIKQFVIQTHFETAMEITPEAKEGVRRLISVGWTVTNQMVFTAAASLRGHTAKLRQTLNDIGVITYYTFSVKGYMENTHNFATNARAVQEQHQEKIIGRVPEKYFDEIKLFPENAANMVEQIDKIRKESDLPFIATDRNVLNLPAVGKSLTFRTVGITDDGRRILEFEHDATRKHSPIIHKVGNIKIVESKSLSKYIRQLREMGEDIEEYTSIFGHSIGETEERMAIYEYPEFNYEVTEKLTNLSI